VVCWVQGKGDVTGGHLKVCGCFFLLFFFRFFLQFFKPSNEIAVAIRVRGADCDWASGGWSMEYGQGLSRLCSGCGGVAASRGAAGRNWVSKHTAQATLIIKREFTRWEDAEVWRKLGALSHVARELPPT